MRTWPVLNDFPAFAGSPAGNDSGTCITNGSSGTTSWSCSQERADSVQAARKTFAVLPPKASLTVFRSISGIEAKDIDRRSARGALNTVRGPGALVDGV